MSVPAFLRPEILRICYRFDTVRLQKIQHIVIFVALIEALQHGDSSVWDGAR